MLRIDLGAHIHKQLNWNIYINKTVAKANSLCFFFQTEFVGRSTIRALGEIGIIGNERNTILEEIAEATDKASTWLWIKRGQQQWSER